MTLQVVFYTHCDIFLSSLSSSLTPSCSLPMTVQVVHSLAINTPASYRAVSGHLIPSFNLVGKMSICRWCYWGKHMETQTLNQHDKSDMKVQVQSKWIRQDTLSWTQLLQQSRHSRSYRNMNPSPPRDDNPAHYIHPMIWFNIFSTVNMSWGKERDQVLVLNAYFIFYMMKLHAATCT